MFEQIDLFGDLPSSCNDFQAQSHDISWGEEEISILRVNMLDRVLSVLNDKRSTTQAKAEAKAWLESDRIGPFTYRVCCMDAEVDFEDFREQITNLVIRHQLN